MANGKQDGIVIDFIDPLFAVVLHISFVEVMSKPWFSDLRLIFRPPFFFQLGTLFLVYITIINSWIGYHQSIKTSPIDVAKFWGRCRFLLDIVLLIFYFILVTGYEDFRRELWVLVVIFLIFVLWDQCKRAEISDTSENSSARRGVTVIWFLIFLIFFVVDRVVFKVPCLVELRSWVEQLILFAAIASNILYRLHKGNLQPKGLLVFLGVHKTDG
jgi:hypothetical protein